MFGTKTPSITSKRRDNDHQMKEYESIYRRIQPIPDLFSKPALNLEFQSPAVQPFHFD